LVRLPKKAIDIYTEYARRLWKETDPKQRRRIAKDKATAAIRRVEHAVGEEYVEFSEEAEEAREKLLHACQDMLLAIGKSEDRQQQQKQHNLQTTTTTATTNIESHDQSNQIADANENKMVAHIPEEPLMNEKQTEKKKKKNRRSILFGAVMGAIVACWVFSGNWIFTGLFTSMTTLGQLEYYRMVMNTGVYPARRISVIGACSMFLSALFAPNLHQICLPMFGLWAMIWFLTMRRRVASIPEIATTFTGMFYLGYVPSFWVRIRVIGANSELTKLAPIVGPILKQLGRKAESLPSFIPQAIHLPITTGSIFIFWTWLCLAFSDVAAYFVGRSFGKTKLGKIAPAAEATSPNKSLEGLLGGMVVSAGIGILGAWVQNWPHYIATGAIHGALLALLGLIGDLTASMLKRDAGLKDFGDLIPEHGGIMDRVDSFVWTAPYSWLVCAYIIPALKQMARAKVAIPI